MKIGMPILFEYNTISENVLLAKKLGFDFIELNLNFAYCREALEKPQELSELLLKNNIEATLHFYDEADFASYDEVVDAYLKLLNKYATLGNGFVKLLNVHLNAGPVVTISGVKNYIYAKEYQTYIKRLERNLSKAKLICERNNIDLVVENTTFPEYMKMTYKDLNDKGYTFNYDIGHDNTSGGHIYKLAEEYKLRFLEFHIHDSKEKWDHLALGLGEMDIKYFKELAQKNNAYVVIEVKSSGDLISSIAYFKNL